MIDDNAMRSIDCKVFGKTVYVKDLVGKYGDWLFKQPLILALEKEGFKINASNNPYPPLINASDRNHSQSLEWTLIFTRNDEEIINLDLAKQQKFIVEIRRVSRSVEAVKIWGRGVLTNTKNFEFAHEQERVRAIARYLCLPYQERLINVVKPRGKIFAVNMNVGEGAANRLSFNFGHVKELTKKLRKQDCEFRVIRDISQTRAELASFYKQFSDNEILDTKSFQEACRVVDACDFYFGADSGLSHYAVQSGKVAFALYSLNYHGRTPLFQSTFRNHLCYFGDTAFSGELLSDFRRINGTCADEKTLHKINRFLDRGTGIDADPYNNGRKIFTLHIDFLSQDGYRKNLAKEIYVNSANIFFTDEVIGLDIGKLLPVHGKVFIDSRRCAQKLHALIASHPDSKNISFYAKVCSFFYGTAMRDGSSDVDLPTLHFQGKVTSSRALLHNVELVLRRSGFAVELPHQTPAVSTRFRSLRPVIKSGRLVYSSYVQEDEYNFQKYEARIKLKIILGEMSHLERQELDVLLQKTENGKKLLREINYLERESDSFEKWGIFVRKIIRATSMLGDFGSKGHVFLRVGERECEKIAAAINGLMRHGIVYVAGMRLYPLWNIRRPQHGWFQPISILAKWRAVLDEQIKEALKSPIYSASKRHPLKLLSHSKLSFPRAVNLLSSADPLIFMEAYRYIATRRERFGRKFFSREELREYAREDNSNCDNARDRKLALWSLATGMSLPLSGEDMRRLTKYNCFVQFFTSGGFDIEKTKFFNVKRNHDVSTRDFVEPFIERIVRLFREYYLYSLATGFPKEFLHEKRKEILFTYFVQGRALLEGPATQSKKASKFLHSLHIAKILSGGRYLREIINSRVASIHLRPIKSLLVWLIQKNKPEESFIMPPFNRVILSSREHHSDLVEDIV